MSASAPPSEEFPRCDVDRGPNWLFVKLHPAHAEIDSADEAKEWADELWSISSRHFIYRLVVEMDEVEGFSDDVTQQLSKLRERLASHGGALRLCGLSPGCERNLANRRVSQTLRNHRTRAAAVLGDN